MSQEALQIIKTDPKVQAGDQARIRELIETKLTPHFDIDRMTALAAGRAYRTATPEQKKRLGEEFKTLLIRTYSRALNQYRDQTIDYKPLRADPERDRRHRAHRSRPSRPAAGADRLQHGQDAATAGRRTTSIVGGVSLVTNYRDEFTQQVQAGGVDGLIRSLAAKNARRRREVIDAPAGDGSRAGRRLLGVERRLDVRRRADARRRRRRARGVAGAAVAGERGRRLQRLDARRFRGARHDDRAEAARGRPKAARSTLRGLPASLRSLAVVYGVENLLADAAS